MSRAIDPYVYQVRNASYGKDVREAIAKSMEETYDSCAGGLTDEARQALLALLAKVAYTVDDGQEYLDALEDALYNIAWPVTNTLTHASTSNAAESTPKGGAYSATITAGAGYTLTGATVSITMGGVDITSTAYSSGTISIAAVTGALVITVTAAEQSATSLAVSFTQGSKVFYEDVDTLDDLRQYITVTATMEDNTSVVVTDYTLSGTLEAGTSTITASYLGASDTFSVVVSALGSIPSGYTAYDYVYNNKKGGNSTTNNGICVDTGLAGSTYSATVYSHDILVTVNVSGAANSVLCGSRSGTGDTNLNNSRVIFIGTVNSKPQFGFQYNGGAAWPPELVNNGTYRIITKDTNVYINGELKAENLHVDTTFTPTSYNIALFGECRGSFYAVKETIKIRHFIVRDANGLAVAAMFPCVNSSSVAGFYDVVREAFYAGRTESYLTAGNDT